MEWLGQIFNAPLTTILVLGGFVFLILGLGVKLPKMSKISKKIPKISHLDRFNIYCHGICIVFSYSRRRYDT